MEMCIISYSFPQNLNIWHQLKLWDLWKFLNFQNKLSKFCPTCVCKSLFTALLLKEESLQILITKSEEKKLFQIRSPQQTLGAIMGLGCFFSFFHVWLLPQREWSRDVEEERQNEKKKKKKGERIPDMLEENQICEAAGCRFRDQTTCWKIVSVTLSSDVLGKTKNLQLSKA